MKLDRALSQSVGTICVYGDLIRHFGNMDFACVLSEIIKTSEEELSRDPKNIGWFPRTYETWQQITGISSSRVRDVCMKLATEGFIQVAVWPRGGSRVAHFRSVPDYLVQVFGLKIKREKSESVQFVVGMFWLEKKAISAQTALTGSFVNLI